MNAITAELQNLANGSVAAGDSVAVKICCDAIAEIERLQNDLAAVCDILTEEHEHRHPGEPVPDWVTMARSLKEAVEAVKR